MTFLLVITASFPIVVGSLFVFSLLASFRFSQVSEIVSSAVLCIINIDLMRLLTDSFFVLEAHTDRSDTASGLSAVCVMLRFLLPF